MTDHDLLQQYLQARDESAFAQIVRRHGAMVHAVATRIARQDADDIAQAVFLLLARRAGKLSHLSDLGGWLYHTARLTALNANRQRARQKKHIEHFGQIAMNQDSPTHHTETRDLVDAALMRLSDPYRQVLILRYIESLSLEESASRLGLTTQAVAKRAQRGLDKVRDYLHRHGLEYAPDALAASLQLPASRMSELQIAAMTHAAKGSASQLAGSLAATAGSATTAIGIKLVAILIILTATIGGAIAIIRFDHVGRAVSASSTSTTGPNATIAAPSTMPDLNGDGARQFAMLFLTALQNRDVPHLAGLIEGDSPAQKTSLAQSYIAQFRDGPYANSPGRLVQISMGMTLVTLNGKLTTALVQCPAPTAADLRSLQLKLNAGQGRWVLDSIKYVLIPALESLAKKTAATLPAGAAASQNTSAAAAFAPPMQVTCGWDGKKVTLPPALIVPPWLMQTDAFKQWETIRDSRTIQIAGNDGFTYEIFIFAGIKEADGSTRPLFNEVRQYRKDGTLAALSQFFTSKSDPAAWVQVDPTGTRLTFLAQRKANSMEVRFFNPDGGFRDWIVNHDGRVMEETLESPLAETIRTLHSAWPKPKPATAPATNPHH